MPDDVAVNPVRLPRTVVPRHYDLHLRPDLAAATFEGSVAIEVEVLDTVDEVQCHADELAIDAAWLEDAAGATVQAAVQLDTATERLTLSLERPADRGEWTIHLRFRGELNDKLRGFYRSTYTDEDGAAKVLATTQFEATDARRCFPCWDEPDAKATFAITLRIDEGDTAVSNAAIRSTTPMGDGTVEVAFETTMPMSTYLVAFVIGDLEVSREVAVRGTPVRVVHVPGKSHLTSFALEVASFALAFFEDWYDIPYPGDTLDLVAIPDFAFGAMENLGCVTFREVLLLVDPERSTQAELQNVVDVIAHELAHMWFGDLVTMRWWEGIWLNEAFATFMEMLATDAFRPAWQRWVSFGLSRAAAFDVDALDATRPIEYEVSSPEEAEGMFDILTYEKGCSVVRMLQQFLGEDDFRAGIQRYLRAHEYGNTATTDLWDALEAASGEPIRRVADSWIMQGGFPVVHAAATQSGVVLHQSRFRYLGGDDGRRWGVPVLWRAEVDGEERSGRLLLDDEQVAIELGGRPAWIVLNAGGHGFYRCELSEELLALTVAAAADGALPSIERFGLVDDSWALTLAGARTAVEHLALVEALAAGERDLSVWEKMLGTVRWLDRLVDGSARDVLGARIRAALGPLDTALGREPRADDDDRTRALRGLVLGALATVANDPTAIDRCLALDEAAQADPESADPALAAAALSFVAARADEATAARLWDRFQHADTPQAEVRLLMAMATMEDPALLAAFVPRLISDEVRTQNGPYALRQALGVRGAGEVVWAFIVEHWDAIGERFPSNSIARMLEGIRALDTPALASSVTTFLDTVDVPQGAQIIAQHRERLAVNVALREREAVRLTAHLSAPATR